MSGSQVPLDELGGDEEPAGTGTGTKTRREPTAKNARADKELRDGILRRFERIEESLVARGDTRLAEILKDDADVMAGFLVSFTRPLAGLRSVIKAGVALIEPALAFGRLFRELAGRWAERRAERQAATPDETPPIYPVQ